MANLAESHNMAWLDLILKTDDGWTSTLNVEQNNNSLSNPILNLTQPTGRFIARSFLVQPKFWLVNFIFFRTPPFDFTILKLETN